MKVKPKINLKVNLNLKLNMASFVRDLSKAKDEIKHNVNLSKKELHA